MCSPGTPCLFTNKVWVDPAKAGLPTPDENERPVNLPCGHQICAGCACWFWSLLATQVAYVAILIAEVMRDEFVEKGSVPPPETLRHLGADFPTDRYLEQLVGPKNMVEAILEPNCWTSKAGFLGDGRSFFDMITEEMKDKKCTRVPPSTWSLMTKNKERLHREELIQVAGGGSLHHREVEKEVMQVRVGNLFFVLAAIQHRVAAPMQVE